MAPQAAVTLLLLNKAHNFVVFCVMFGHCFRQQIGPFLRIMIWREFVEVFAAHFPIRISVCNKDTEKKRSSFGKLQHSQFSMLL